MARERTATKGLRMWVRGKVNILQQGEDSVVAEVKGDHGVYLVRLDQEQASCQCPWFLFKGSSKPCSHIEAVREEMNGNGQLHPVFQNVLNAFLKPDISA